MRVELVSWADQAIERESNEWPKLESRPGSKPIDWMALISAVNSTANLETKQGKLVTVGNYTEGALLHWLRDAGVEYGEWRRQFPPLSQVHFTSERKRMTTVIQRGEQTVALVKGAPEWLLDSCKEYLDPDGTARTLNEEMRGRIRQNLQVAARKVMRTLAFAYAPQASAEASSEGDLVYVGFVAIRDPLRDDVKDALTECRDAGIEVKMVTGDNVETARAIAAEIGLIASDAPADAVLTTTRFNELSDDDLKRLLPSMRVLARARPLDKYRLVRLLQELGEVVAVTGDGTNDAPALKKADVGLAMGIAGTEVAKEASKIVLLDDAFSTIVNAVHWGRSLYENIQRFVQFQLTINVSALAITFLGIVFLNVKAPFTVLQLLWINVIMDTLASIALCSEPPRPGVMKLPPKKRDENILTPAMLTTIFSTAAFFVVVMLGLLVAMKNGFLAGGDMPQEGFTVRQGTLFFSIYVFFQVWNQFNARALTPDMSSLTGIVQNPTFLWIAGLIAVGQMVIVTVGGAVFKVEPLGLLDWLGVIAFTSSVLIFAEIARRVRHAQG
jgi:Ca2+-transporting ATPase